MPVEAALRAASGSGGKKRCPRNISVELCSMKRPLRFKKHPFLFFWRIFYNAMRHFIEEYGSAFASYITLSGMMAFFPFLIFTTGIAGFVGAKFYTETSLNYILDMLPKALVQPVGAEITNVMTTQRGGLLTISALAAAYFASNGVESLRTALNRAYRVHDKRSIVFCRFQSLFFVILGTVSFVIISLLLVLAPLVLVLLQRETGSLAPYLGTIRFWRYCISIIVLLIGLFITHKWLPAGKRSFFDIAPGIGFTFATWLVASVAFAQYLASFASYVSTYAGLASIVVAMVFLYMLSAIFIIGGEINAAIMFYRNRRQQPGQPIEATSPEKKAGPAARRLI